MKRLAVVFAVPAGMAAVVMVLMLRAAPKVPTFRVARSELTRTVTADGELEAVESTKLTAPVAHRRLTVAWLVEDGTPVKQGDVIVRFEKTELEQELDQADDEIATLEEQLAREKAGQKARTVELDNEAFVDEKEASWARAYQATDEEIYSKHELLSSAVDAELAESRRDHALGLLEVEKNLAQTKVDILKISLANARRKAAEIREDLAGLELKAPHDGIAIIARDWQGRPVRIGDGVWPGRLVAELPDLGRMQAIVWVLEADAGGLESGQPADIVVSAFPEKHFRASVSQVDPVAQPRIEDLPVQYFRSTLSLEKTVPDIMKPGARIKARITIERLHDALVIPREAVFQRDGDTIVYRRRGRRFEPVPVTTGSSTASRVVVTKGLEEGDTIALANPTRTKKKSQENSTSHPPMPGGGS